MLEGQINGENLWDSNKNCGVLKNNGIPYTANEFSEARVDQWKDKVYKTLYCSDILMTNGRDILTLYL